MEPETNQANRNENKEENKSNNDNPNALPAIPYPIINSILKLSLLDKVPQHFKKSFLNYARLVCSYLTTAFAADDATVQEDAVLTFLRLPSLALRKPRRGGRKARQRQSRNYDREMDAIIRSWQPNTLRQPPNEQDSHHDRNATSNNAASQNASQPLAHSSESKRDERKIRIDRAKSLARRSHLSKAVKSLLQSGLSVLTEAKLNKLEQLHPQGPANCPVMPQNAPPVPVSEETMLKIVSKLNNGSSPDIFGWTGDILHTIVKDATCRDGILRMVTAICNGEATKRVRDLIYTDKLLATDKPNEVNGVRPIARGSILAALTHGVAYYQLSKEDLDVTFGNIQLGCGNPGGSESAVHIIRTALDRSLDLPAMFQLDIRNAFNSADRALILERLYNNRHLAPIWRAADQAYNTPSDLLVIQNKEIIKVIKSTQGVKQGDKIALIAYANYMQPIFRQAAETKLQELPDLANEFGIQLPNNWIHATQGRSDKAASTAIADDFATAGNIYPSLAVFLKALKLCRDEDIAVRLDKCSLLWPHPAGQDPPPFYNHVCNALQIRLAKGSVKYLGIHLGYDEDQIKNHIRQVVENAQPLFDALAHPAMPKQIALLLLRLCGVPKVNYLSRTLPPRLLAQGAQTFDERVLETANHILNISPTHNDIPLDTKAQINMPLRFAGLGLRPATRSSKVAYWSSVAQAAPLLLHYFDNIALQPLVDTLDMIRLSLKDNGMTPDNPVFPLDEEAHLDFYATLDMKLKKNLQNKIMRPIEQRMFANRLARPCLNILDISSRARLISASQTNASAWLIAMPTSPALELTDREFIFATRHRLGLPISNALPGHCPLCNNAINLAEQPSHFGVCKSLTSRSVTARHHHLTRLASSLFRRLGAFYVREEPYDFQSRQHTRPDVVAYFPTLKLATDVSVTDPTARSYVQGAARAPLHAATARERNKINKHRNGANNENLTFFPCVYESFGPPGKATAALWKQLHLQATYNRVPECPTLTQINQEISINIMKGTAMIAEEYIANVTCYEDTGTSLLRHTSAVIEARPPQSQPNSFTRRGIRRLIPNNDNPARRGRLVVNVPLWEDVTSQASRPISNSPSASHLATAGTLSHHAPLDQVTNLNSSDISANNHARQIQDSNLVIPMDTNPLDSDSNQRPDLDTNADDVYPLPTNNANNERLDISNATNDNINSDNDSNSNDNMIVDSEVQDQSSFPMQIARDVSQETANLLNSIVLPACDFSTVVASTHLPSLPLPSSHQTSTAAARNGTFTPNSIDEPSSSIRSQSPEVEPTADPHVQAQDVGPRPPTSPYSPVRRRRRQSRFSPLHATNPTTQPTSPSAPTSTSTTSPAPASTASHTSTAAARNGTSTPNSNDELSSSSAAQTRLASSRNSTQTSGVLGTPFRPPLLRPLNDNQTRRRPSRSRHNHRDRRTPTRRQEAPNRSSNHRTDGNAHRRSNRSSNRNSIRDNQVDNGRDSREANAHANTRNPRNVHWRAGRPSTRRRGSLPRTARGPPSDGSVGFNHNHHD
jgi:hypothetical protein